MLKTRMTALFSIRYPIMQGGMQYLGTPSLAAAVSEAGGLGTINAATFPEEAVFRAKLRELRRMTEKPFCVNFSLIPEFPHTSYLRQLEILAEEGGTIVETAGANPQDLVPAVKACGFLWIHKAPALRHALKAQALGADAVTLAGSEVGGHPGADEVGANVLVRRAARELEIPVLAAGGYSDGAGLAAALALGAEGVVMGTRFVASAECACHENFKNWILSAGEADTVIVQRSIHNMMRAANNAAARRCLAMEAEGASLQELMEVISGRIGKRCYETGDTDGGIFPIGQGVGLIDEVKPAARLLEDIAAEAEEAIRRLGDCCR